MQEFEVGFLRGEEGFAGVDLGGERVAGWVGPEDVVVVGEGGEEDAEEEAGRWRSLLVLRPCLGRRETRTADDEEGREWTYALE